MFNNFFFEHLAVYKIMWKNMVEAGRLQMTIWHGEFALRGGYLRLQTHTQDT